MSGTGVAACGASDDETPPRPPRAVDGAKLSAVQEAMRPEEVGHGPSARTASSTPPHGVPVR